MRRSCFSTPSTERRTCSITGRSNSRGELELRGEKRSLASAVEPGHEVVEADLADRDQARIVALRVEQRLAQPVEVGVGHPVDAHRVDAERVGQAMPRAPARAPLRSCRPPPPAARSGARPRRARARPRHRGRRRIRRRPGGNGCRSTCRDDAPGGARHRPRDRRQRRVLLSFAGSPALAAHHPGPGRGRSTMKKCRSTAAPAAARRRRRTSAGSSHRLRRRVRPPQRSADAAQLRPARAAACRAVCAMSGASGPSPCSH